MRIYYKCNIVKMIMNIKKCSYICKMKFVELHL